MVPIVEPDDRMGGSELWPDDWSTGWVSGRWVDATGAPLTGTVELTLSVVRAASSSTRTTIVGGKRIFEVVDGVPAGPHAVTNSDGVPCVEFPVTNDPDIRPTDLQLVVKEWGGTYRRDLTADHTLENPLWLTGDLISIAAQPGVIRSTVWEVHAAPGNIPADAAVGDWIAYLPSGLVTKRTS